MAAMERRVEPVICDGLASYPRKVHCRLLRSISLRRIDRCPSPSEAGSGWEAVPCGRHDRFAVQNSAVWHRSSKSIARVLQLARPKTKASSRTLQIGCNAPAPAEPFRGCRPSLSNGWIHTMFPNTTHPLHRSGRWRRYAEGPRGVRLSGPSISRIPSALSARWAQLGPTLSVPPCLVRWRRCRAGDSASSATDGRASRGAGRTTDRERYETPDRSAEAGTGRTGLHGPSGGIRMPGSILDIISPIIRRVG